MKMSSCDWKKRKSTRKLKRAQTEVAEHQAHWQRSVQAGKQAIKQTTMNELLYLTVAKEGDEQKELSTYIKPHAVRMRQCTQFVRWRMRMYTACTTVRFLIFAVSQNRDKKIKRTRYHLFRMWESGWRGGGGGGGSEGKRTISDLNRHLNRHFRWVREKMNANANQRDSVNYW